MALCWIYWISRAVHSRLLFAQDAAGADEGPIAQGPRRGIAQYNKPLIGALDLKDAQSTGAEPRLNAPQPLPKPSTCWTVAA